MNLISTERKIFEHLADIKVIDAHEHLGPEKERLQNGVDVVCLLAGPYTGIDLITSGMPHEFPADIWGRYPETDQMLIDTKIPLEKRWKIVSPYMKNIRYGSYARAVYLSLKELYGFDDINDSNYKEISDTMAQANKPGIYKKILLEKCNIQAVLTECNRTDFDVDLLKPVMLLDKFAAVQSKKFIEENAAEIGVETKTLDDYLQLTRIGLERWKSQGVVGIKMISRPYAAPERSRVASLFDKLMHNPNEYLPPTNPLQSFLIEEILDMAADLELVVAVHTGVWGDFRTLDPQHMIPILARHPKTKFDIYHMGIPYVRETEIIGKNFPNTWLNLSWVHLVSQKIACSALDELIDIVPVNKIIAFGGDYGSRCAESIYGHLYMTKENIAKVLGRRIEEGLMTMKDVLELAEAWFYHVPKNLYQLS